MSARFHAIVGCLIAFVLFGLVHWLRMDVPVFSAHPGVSALHFDEASLYAPGVRRFADTFRPAWELDVIELRGERFAYPIMHQIVLGTLARVTGSVDAAFILAHALLPTLIWCSFFCLMLLATQNAPLSSSTAWAACIVAAAPRNALLFGADSFLQPLEITRTPHPALSTAILLLVLFGMLKCLATTEKKWPWLTGVLLGSLCYTYYFHTVAAWMAAGCLMLFAWRRMSIVAITGLVTAIPYFVWTISSMRSGNSRPLMSRIGFFERVPDWPGIVGMVLFAVLFVGMGLRRQRDDKAAATIWILSALMVGAFFVTNLHLLTGYNAQHEHAYNRLIQPFGLVLAAMGVRRWLKAVPMGWLMNVASVAIVSLAACRQVHVADVMRRFQDESADRHAVLAELDRTPGELVVGTLDEQIRALAPACSRHWSFVPIGFRTLASNEEILMRFVIVAKLSGVTRDESLALLTRRAAEGQMRTYCYGLLDDHELAASDAQLFERLWSATDPVQALGHRRLDVLMLPPGKKPALIVGIRFAPAFESDGWTAFRVTVPPAR